MLSDVSDHLSYALSFECHLRRSLCDAHYAYLHAAQMSPWTISPYLFQAEACPRVG